MLPEQRELVKHMQGKPFVLLGINSDRDRSVLKEKFEKEQITWPNIIGGEPRKNEICRKWNVRGFPTLFVLDHEGKIFKRGYLSHDEVAKAAEELVAKAPR